MPARSSYAALPPVWPGACTTRGEPGTSSTSPSPNPETTLPRSSQVPWLPIAAAGFLGMLLALSRIPVVARALTAPGMASRLALPQAFRVTGVFFLLYLAFGHLPALFARRES